MALTSFIKAFLPLISEGISKARAHTQKQHVAFAVARAPPGPGPCLPKNVVGFTAKQQRSQADNRSHLQFLKAKLCRKLTESKQLLTQGILFSFFSLIGYHLEEV